MVIKYLCRKCRETSTLEELEENITDGEMAKSFGFKTVFKCECGSYAFEMHRGEI